MKGGNYATIQEMVREQFLPQEVEEAVLKEVVSGETPSHKPTSVSPSNPFVSAVPLTESGKQALAR